MTVERIKFKVTYVFDRHETETDDPPTEEIMYCEYVPYHHAHTVERGEAAQNFAEEWGPERVAVCIEPQD